MNKALVELIRKYEKKADAVKDAVKEKSFIAVLYYDNAAKRVLALASQVN